MRRFNSNKRIDVIGINGSNEKIVDKLKSVRRLLQHIDFGCNFVGNRCVGHMDGDCVAACCSGCANTHGYMSLVVYEDIGTYENLYDGILGFWRPNKGCMLPFALRSRTCLSYMCPTIRNMNTNTSFEVSRLIKTISDIEKDLKTELRTFTHMNIKEKKQCLKY